MRGIFACEGGGTGRRLFRRGLMCLSIALCAAVGCYSADRSEGLADDAPQAGAGAGPVDLLEELGEGRVSLESAWGNGSSSGASVQGLLRNNTEARIRLAIQLARPLYLRNRGRGQNMVAFQVLLEGGRYVTDGQSEFIELEADRSTQVVFTAFCADFERENPSGSDRFTPEDLPPSVAGVSDNISRYLSERPTADITVPAQVALWLAQGEPAQSIQERFPFTADEERLARQLLPGRRESP